MRCLYPTNAGRPRPATGTSRQMFCFDASKRSAQKDFHAAWCVLATGGLLVSRSRDFLKVEAACVFCAVGAFKKPLWRPWFFSSFARYRAGSDPCRSGSVIGASLAASMAPMTLSGGDGRWKHREQACFLVALLYSSAPCWRLLRGCGERRRYSAFAGWGALVLKVTGGRGYRGELVQVEGGNY